MGLFLPGLVRPTPVTGGSYHINPCDWQNAAVKVRGGKIARSDSSSNEALSTLVSHKRHGVKLIRNPEPD